MLQSEVWTGAGCVSFNLSSNVTATSSANLVNFGDFWLGSQTATVASCSGNKCSVVSTVTLDPTSYYAFNMTNTGLEPIWVAISFVLHPSNSSGSLSRSLVLGAHSCWPSLENITAHAHRQTQTSVL